MKLNLSDLLVSVLLVCMLTAARGEPGRLKLTELVVSTGVISPTPYRNTTEASSAAQPSAGRGAPGLRIRALVDEASGLCSSDAVQEGGWWWDQLSGFGGLHPHPPITTPALLRAHHNSRLPLTPWAAAPAAETLHRPTPDPLPTPHGCSRRAGISF